MRSGLVLLVVGAERVTRALAIALASRAQGVVIVQRDERIVTADDAPPKLDLEALTRALPHYPEYTVERAADYAEHEVAQLRRDNQWREKRNRAMFNVRANADRRRRKAARGIGRR